MENLEKSYLESLKGEKKNRSYKTHSYDFIAKYGYEFSKSQLLDIILEMDYAISNLFYSDAEECYKNVIEGLTDMGWNEED